MAKSQTNQNTYYDDLRKKRMEENVKRMAELNLTKLAQNLRTNTSPKPTPMKHVKPRAPRIDMSLAEVRRSSRVKTVPTPFYKEIPIEAFKRPKRYSGKRRDLSGRVYASEEDRSYAKKRAEELESSLEDGYPSFVKPMLQSHVTGGFWLGLPLQFCKKNLPKRDEEITLVDEHGEQFLTKYLAQKAGLSAGWRGFAIEHKLVDGDALAFQLVKPTEFKVYIIRVNGSSEEDDAV